jgi:hypothetical protein
MMQCRERQKGAITRHRRDYSMIASARAISAGRYGQSHCLGGLEIEHQLEFRGLEEWQVAGPGPLEDAANINAALVVLVDRAGTVTDQPAGRAALDPRNCENTL